MLLLKLKHKSKANKKDLLNSSHKIETICPYGKEVNTSPSHGEVCGSIPHMGTTH